ncbi:hypothetical protein SAMN04490243_2586 [Robiginitalea myxolifaciens]|uniref:Amidohydrolase 3 domain-containing protein n=1 Tax=Robiginitalea myxolifaciens TaxID=400055 RepID=A0A1I6HD63_9FLAO|nr:amidohydrolase [Robiginitalea myxolifaciens]SFR52389.1 hypothetical protein SAMN04490243_2586 [Robiginitalea myxolifaciens]
MRLFRLTLLVASAVFLACQGEQETESPATMYFNGDILTMVGATPEYVEALVERDGKILFVGDTNKAMQIAGKGHIMKNLQGATMLPGLIDGHAHFANFGLQAVGAQLLAPPDADVANIPKLIEVLKAWNTPENRSLTGWIFGTGFDDSVLEEKRFPTRHDLDQVTEEFPIMIMHISGHFAVVNSKGLEVLGITAETPDPEGGIIRREANSREPNGVLEELAAIPNMIAAMMPKTPEANQMFFDAGQEMALSYGYTTAQEGRAMQNHELLTAMASQNKLKIDVVSYIDYMFTDQYMGAEWNSKAYTNHYRIGGMKITLDGSPQGRTAWRTKPYLIPPDGMGSEYSGYPAIPDDSTVRSILERGFQNDWQILAHANGDAAIDQLLSTMESLHQQYKPSGRRDVIIHGQYIREDQLNKAVSLNLIGSLFPMHTFYWGDWHKQLIGDSLGNKISPVRSALDKGLKITLHTDAPVALPNLMRVVWTAVARTSRSGETIGAEERITPYEALQSITSWSAFQHFEEDQKGTLEPGKLADLVILDNNPLKVPAAEIKNIQVMETIKEGETVYQRSTEQQ